MNSQETGKENSRKKYWRLAAGYILLFVITAALAIMFLLDNYLITIDLEKRLKISVDDLHITTQIDQEINVRMDSIIAVPIKATIDVPLSVEVLIDDIFNVDTIVPVSIVLTEKEVQLTNIEVPIETDIPIDELITINATIPIDTTLRTYAGVPVKVKGDIPIHANIPIKQNIHIKKKLRINISQFNLALNMDLPIKIKAPIKQPVSITGIAPIKIDKTVDVPINAIIPVNFSEPFQARIGIEGAMSANAGRLYLDYEAIGISKKIDAQE